MHQSMHCKKSNVFHPLHVRETFKFVCMSVCRGKMSVSAYLFLCSPKVSLFQMFPSKFSLRSPVLLNVNALSPCFQKKPLVIVVVEKGEVVSVAMPGIFSPHAMWLVEVEPNME